MNAIVTKKQILGGKPIIRGTRISVDLISSFIANDMTIEDIKKSYPSLTDEQIKAALDYLTARAVSEGKKIEPANSKI